MRLIDADKMDVLEHLDYNYHPEKDGDAWYKAKDVWDCIDKEPTIDPESLRPHGRWIVRGQDIFCSECKCESGHNAFGASSFSDYCPNCGAIMDGDE